MVVYDRTLQIAALFAVLFVLFTGLANAAMAPTTERAIIEAAFQSGVSPSLALAVATVEAGRRGQWSATPRIRTEIRNLRDLLARYPDNPNRALMRFSKIRDPELARRYVGMVRDWTTRFETDARQAARALATPSKPRSVALDDFDGSIAGKIRRVRDRLDDFPVLRRRS